MPKLFKHCNLCVLVTIAILATANLALAQAQDKYPRLKCSSTDFSLRLFNAVAKESNENVIISPFGAYLALSMVVNGADGSTRDQMAKTLGVTGDTIALLNERNHSLLTQLNSNDKIKLKIANTIFADKTTPFKTSFIDVCKQIYDAEAECGDFRNCTDLLKSINTWCDAKTEGKIPTIIDSLMPSEKMVVLNALYFKGDWANVFKKTETQDDKFITASGDITDIKMMQQRQKLPYFKGDTFKAVAIPYLDNRQSLCIFLPNKKVNLSLFQAEFTEKNWREWLGDFRPTDVNLSLPKFAFRDAKDLSAALKSIGMTEAFDAARADFSKLVCFGYKASISRVLQKTYIDIDEEGTEAAAATSVPVAVRTAVVSPQPIEFRVDHPFVMALVDNENKEILFFASIVKP